MYIFVSSTVLRLVIALLFAGGAGVRRPVAHTFRKVFTRVISFRPGQGPGAAPDRHAERRRARQQPVRPAELEALGDEQQVERFALNDSS
jgi:hypothetical protein